MFSKFFTTNNGDFEKLPKEIIDNMTINLDQKSKSNLSQLNKFFNQLSKEQALKREENLFVLYSLMTQSVEHILPHECARCRLEQQLFVSQDTFLEEARIVLSSLQIPLENMDYKGQFASLISDPNSSEAKLNNMKESLHSFLYSLCFIRAINSLYVFVKKYPNTIKALPTEEFNSLCVAAATNHLFEFMDYLCQQGRSIDEYTEIETVPITAPIAAMLTPLAAAFLGVFRSGFRSDSDSPSIASGKKIIELLLENNANLNKQYIRDDLSTKAMIETLNQGKGYSIVDNCVNCLEEYKNKTSRWLTKSNIHTNVILDFMRYILSLKSLTLTAKTNRLAT